MDHARDAPVSLQKWRPSALNVAAQVINLIPAVW